MESMVMMMVIVMDGYDAGCGDGDGNKGDGEHGDDGRAAKFQSKKFSL